ncbi:MAG: ABC transporter substrate-binding protein [Pseudomonadota bacterium]
MLRILFALGLLVACSRPVAVEEEPSAPRLASFSPALTELLFSMGLGAQVVGVTRYCELPAGEERPVLGDAITVSAEGVLAVAPDVLLIQSDPARFAPIQQLDPALQIEHFSIETIADIAAAQRRLGVLAGQPARGDAAARAFEAGLEEVRAKSAGLARPRLLFVTGSEKPGTAGQGTFVDELIGLAGAENAAAHLHGWATLDLEYVLAAEPHILVCWSPAADSARDLARWRALEDLPAARDGRVYGISAQSWITPTPKLVGHAEELLAMVHPELAAP